MTKQYLLPIIVAAFLLLTLAAGSAYFIYKIFHPSFETNPVTQSYTQTTPTQNQELASVTTTIDELRFSLPSLVSWQDQNETNISLTAVSLAKTNETGKDNYILNLNLEIKTANSGFCSASFSNYSLRRLVNEQGVLASPIVASPRCLSANSVDNQIVSFNLPAIEKETIIQVLNQSGELQTFFTVKILGNKVEVEPAPKQG